MNGKQNIIELLYRGNYSCVIAQGNDIRIFRQRGIKDLFELVNNDRGFLRGASIADKVIGKAAAALIIEGGIQSVYADVISLSALSLLEKSHIPVEFGNLVPYIRNHTGNDWCPMEKLCYEIASVNDILDAIQRFITKKT